MDQFCVNHPASTVKHWEFALFLVWHGLCSKGMQAEQLSLLKAEPKDKKDAQMKTIALSMIFSLAVILCEQQTLFAALPTYTNVASSLIPIAGADSLNVSKAIAAPQTYGLNPGGTSLMYEQGSRMHDSGEPIRDVDLPQTVNGVTVPYWNVLPPDAQDSFSHNLEW